MFGITMLNRHGKGTAGRRLEETWAEGKWFVWTYCYFMLLADAWMSDDSTSAWLIPSEFMDVNYGKVLRIYLTERVSLHQIHRYSFPRPV